MNSKPDITEDAAAPAGGNGRQAAHELATVHDAIPVMDSGRFEHMQRIASTIAQGAYVPETLKGKGENGRRQTVANVFRVVNQAVRMKADPFSLIDHAFIVHGKLGLEGKAVAAFINSSGDLVGRLTYEYSGDKGTDNRKVIVRGTFSNTGETAEVDGTVGEWQTSNNIWTEQPDQQLAYRGAVVWARRHMPEVLLGIYTDDDIDRMRDAGDLRMGMDGVWRPAAEPEGDRPVVAVSGAAPAQEESWLLLNESGDEVDVIASLEHRVTRAVHMKARMPDVQAAQSFLEHNADADSAPQGTGARGCPDGDPRGRAES